MAFSGNFRLFLIHLGGESVSVAHLNRNLLLHGFIVRFGIKIICKAPQGILQMAENAGDEKIHPEGVIL